jgi:molybdopterin biosynthesis enzyme
VTDAGPYAPVPLAPPPAWVEHGDPLPAGCDAVLPPDALVSGAAGAEAVGSVAPGEGVLAAAGDAAAGATLARAGQRLRASDVAAFPAAGVSKVAVRAPEVRVVTTKAGLDGVAALVAAALAAEGAVPTHMHAQDAGALADALTAPGADTVMTIGGTGEGRTDGTAHTVAAAGQLLIHGMGSRPGETAGFGVVGERPVLLLPGRLDGALATWLLVGRAILQRLGGVTAPAPAPRLKLVRKITSTIGLAEVVLVRCAGSDVEPLAAGVFPLGAIGQACGWVLVPPESEGYPSGATVDVHPLP